MSMSLLFPLPAKGQKTGRSLSHTLADLVLGPRRSWEADLTVSSVIVKLPEGEYPALVRVFISTEKRLRWPWARKTVKAEIQLFQPIPVPGQNAGAVEIDDYAIYTFTCRALTPEDAVRELVRSVSGVRAKYLKFGWQPADWNMA